MSRPSSFSEEIADDICQRIADGKSLRSICSHEGMPSRESVRRWLADNENFRGQYARAREEQADYYADEIIEIADLAEDPQKARVQIDARKWKASKMAPKKYGDKVEHEHGVTDQFGEFLQAVASSGKRIHDRG